MAFLSLTEGAPHREKYWYYLTSSSLVLDRAYLSDTLGVTFLFAGPRHTFNSRSGGHHES